ncbi:MAG: hypothetical protein OXQ28_03140, partial [Acidobacteriota bacterium]|nr:hypothetical protein [Acidobacteriota bacterium]
MIQGLGNAADGSIWIQSLNTKQEAAILTDSRRVEAIVPQPCGYLSRRAPLLRPLVRFSEDTSRNGNHDIEAARRLPREFLRLVYNVSDTLHALLVLQSV